MHGARFLLILVWGMGLASGCALDPVDALRGVFDDEARPDLRLAASAGAPLTCAPGPSVVVTIENGGAGDAPESITTVVFVPGGSVDVSTPELKADESVELDPVVVPASCFDPDCRFTVLADASFLVDESDESNNRRDGDCLASAAPPQ